MRRGIIVCTVLVSVVIITATNFVDSIVIFLLVGAVPGTSLSIPPSGMMLVIAIVAWLALSYVSAGRLLAFFTMRRLVDRYLARSQRLPKRRYGRI